MMMSIARSCVIRVLLLCLAFFPLHNTAFPTTIGLKGLITGWVTGNIDNITQPFLGIRYIPEFTLKESLGQNLSLDFEISLNAIGTAHVHSLKDTQTDGDFDLYRAWGRFSTSRFEARIGLQKINFGSATLLRPLMWFDSIDPRDPLQLTDGVYGLLLRYYFLNNANIWAWGLYGNDNPKGWDFFPSKPKSAEYGGRLQMPLGTGEWALTYHHRTLDPNRGPIDLAQGDPFVPEDRYALDGKWDLGIGLWFEGTLTHQRTDLFPTPWQRAINIGIDYTFGWGNGLHVLTESFFYTSSDKAFGSGEDITFSALLLGYPLGLLDNLSCIVYYDWDNKDVYSFLNWRRTYDRWTINIIGFWNPEQFQIYQNLPENTLYAGKGFQIMVVFYY